MRFPALALALCLAASAQEPAEKVEVSFYALDYAKGHKDIFVPTGPEAFEEVPLSTANIVGPIRAELREGRLGIHRRDEGPDGTEVYPLISGLRLPGDARRVLVLLAPTGEDEGEIYRSLVFPNDPQGFPLGTYRMVNLSPYPVRGVVGKSIVRAKPGGTGNLKPEGEPGSVQPARFEYHSKDRWNLLTETRCAVRKDRRWLMCVFEDPRSRRINIRSIPDRSVTPTEPVEEE